MTIKIDKNIPAPENHPRNRYPFKNMDIGDSFFVAHAKGNALISASRAWQKNGEKYTARTVMEDGIQGQRIWRIE